MYVTSLVDRLDSLPETYEIPRPVWQEYLETVVKEREGWGDLYRACRELV